MYHPFVATFHKKKQKINDKFTHNKIEISLNRKPWNKLSINNVDIDRNKNNKLMA